MALIAPQASGITGKLVTFAAASAGGDTFAYAPGVALEVKNAGAGSVTLTLVVPGNNEDSVANPDPTYTIANTAGTTYVVKGFTPRHADPVTGLISVTWSGVTSVTVAVVV